MDYQKITPEIGAIINDIDLNNNLNENTYNKIYEILIENLVIVFKKTNIYWPYFEPDLEDNKTRAISKRFA